MNETDNITSLRTIIFETMRSLKDGSIDIEKAKAVGDLGQIIINSAKVEVDAMRVGAIEGSGFIQCGALPGRSPAAGNGTTHPRPGVTRHRCV